MTRTAKRTLAPFSLAVLLACGGGDKNPTSSSPVTQPAKPAPTPTPAPTPFVYVPPGLGKCTLPAVARDVSGCPYESPTFLTQVQTAIDLATQQRPDIFNFNDVRGDGGYKVLSEGQYYVLVLKNLENMGLCAGYDGEEVQVKNTNDFSDQYHILISTGHVNRQASAYKATCYPAAFPLAMGPLPHTPGCALPPSKDLACGREPAGKFEGVIDDAIEQVRREEPTILNDSTVLNPPAYYDAMVRILRSKGYCALFDGEEIAIKNVNDFSEQYQVMLSAGIIRTSPGAYRSSCYPAAF